MKTYFFIVLTFFIIGSFYSKAAEFKLDQIQVENKFSNACEVSLQEVLEPQFLLNQGNMLVSSHVIVGISSIFCGTIGLHRFILNQNASGIKHVSISGLALLTLVVGFIITGLETTNIGDSAFAAGIIMATTAAVVELVHFSYVLVEGVIYLCTPAAKFKRQGGLLYDQSFFAPFKRHSTTSSH